MSTASSVFPSNISLYDVQFDLRTPGRTPPGSRRASETSLKGQGCERGRPRLASMISWSGGPSGDAQTVPSSRIINVILRRIEPKDKAVYERYTYFKTRPRQSYTMPELDSLSFRPTIASNFMVDFTIARSTGNMKRSISLAHCRCSCGDQDIRFILERCQLKLSNARQIKIPPGVKLDEVEFSFGLQQSHAYAASLSVDEKRADPARTIERAYIVNLTFERHVQGFILDKIRIQGRTAGSEIKDIEIGADAIDLKALNSPSMVLGAMTEWNRDIWLGDKRTKGQSEVYADWIIRDMTFTYSGAVLGGQVVRVRPLARPEVPSLNPQEGAPIRTGKKKLRGGLFSKHSETWKFDL